MSAEPTLNFGPFSLLPRRRVLLEGGVPVRLGSRAFDLLVTLVERAGEVVPHDDLMAKVWPNAVVEPGALRVHLAGLRKVLGDGRQAHRYIVNIPMQGYCFVAMVTQGNTVELPAAQRCGGQGTTESFPRAIAIELGRLAPAASPVMMSPLPAQVARMVGRDDVVAELVSELRQRRCITVTGPAGMGKTTVALAAARQIAPAFDHQAAFVNLAPLTDAGLVVSTVTAALGVSALEATSLRGLLTYLRHRRLLIVLDNCEHVIDAAAEVAEALLTGAPSVHLLMTSREPLRIQGEWVQRLGPLAVPPALGNATIEQMLGYASVDLFVERVRAGLDSFELCEADLPDLARICQALDGIPLALELAAAGVERLGMRGVAANLGDRLSLLTGGRRNALPRHQTLRAALDWSYALMPEPERCLLRSLSIFRGRFTTEGARALMQGCPAAGAEVEAHLYNLVNKSLLMSDISGDVVQYWLLETTREYALAQLQLHGEIATVARRHATHMVELADAAERSRPHQPQAEWLARHACLLDDLRFALHWSLAEGGDLRIGVALAGASAPLWYALSHMAEYLQLLERLLARLSDAEPLEPSREIALREAHGHALWNIRGAGPAAIAAFERALELAEWTQSIPDQLHALWGLWLVTNSRGDYPRTLQYATRFGERIACAPNAADTIVHDRMMTLSMHFTGQHARAQLHAQRVLAQPANASASTRRSGFQFDQRVAALMTLARILWMRGFPDRALEHAEAAVQRAQDINHSLSLCFAISVGCGPVAFWSGDVPRAARYTSLLRQRAAEYSLTFWGYFGEGYRMVLDRRRGERDDVEVQAGWPRSLRDTLCTLDAELAGEADFERARTGIVPWITPELLRIHGDRLRLWGDVEAGRQAMQAGLRLANRQGARSWALRCATSLAMLLADAGCKAAALDVLAPVYDQFEEGFGTADLQAASRVLEQLN